jgi:hypothetical protein
MWRSAHRRDRLVAGTRARGRARCRPAGPGVRLVFVVCGLEARAEAAATAQKQPRTADDYPVSEEHFTEAEPPGSGMSGASHSSTIPLRSTRRHPPFGISLVMGCHEWQSTQCLGTRGRDLPQVRMQFRSRRDASGVFFGCKTKRLACVRASRPIPRPRSGPEPAPATSCAAFSRRRVRGLASATPVPKAHAPWRR